MEGVDQYSISTDDRGKPLVGEKNYILHLPSKIPSCRFWSLIVYDKETLLMISTDQPWPSVHSNCKKLVINQDDSVDALFGPKVPLGKDSNWVKTIPGKGWNLILRFYGPTESGHYKTWRPGEIEEMNQFYSEK